jgi:hypothetical protein
MEHNNIVNHSNSTENILSLAAMPQPEMKYIQEYGHNYPTIVAG